MEEVKERKTIIVSPAGYFSKQDLQNWGKNLLWYTAPALIVFFGQLAAGVEPRVAAAVALLAFYGAVADALKKYRSENIRLSE